MCFRGLDSLRFPPNMKLNETSGAQTQGWFRGGASKYRRRSDRAARKPHPAPAPRRLEPVRRLEPDKISDVCTVNCSKRAFSRGRRITSLTPSSPSPLQSCTTCDFLLLSTGPQSAKISGKDGGDGFLVRISMFSSSPVKLAAAYQVG